MTPDPDSAAPISLEAMLAAEHAHLHRDDVNPSASVTEGRRASAAAGASAPVADAVTGTSAHTATDVYAALHRCGHSALCLSGGGIRSASFALGVLEGLTRHRILRQFDYLSTVSGGGFAGGWLSGWLFHASAPGGPGAATVFDALGGGALAGDAVEAEPVARMRSAGRYMSPELGMFSTDMWALIATVVRNLFLNLLVLLPLLAATLLLPHLYLGLIQYLYRPVQVAAQLTIDGATLMLGAGGALMAVAFGYIVLQLPSYGNKRLNEAHFVWWSLLPVVLGAVGLTLFWTAEDVRIDLGPTLLMGALAGGGVWTVIGLVGSRRRWRPRTTLGAAAAGALATAGFWGLGEYLFAGSVTCGRLFAMTAVPLVLGVLTIATFVFLGLASAEMGDEDLEWWSRVGAWVLVAAVAWMAVTGLVYYGPAALRAVRDLVQKAPGMEGEGRSTGAIGVLTSALGALSAYAARGGSTEKPGAPSPLKRVALALAAPLFLVSLFASIAWVNEGLLAALFTALNHTTAAIDECGTTFLVPVAILGALFIGLGLAAGHFVPVNQFSLHGMYRERLIRAFLGASRTASVRRPNPFTGFDPDDDIPLHALATVQRPMLVVNLTLNKVADAARGRLQRKGESFMASPLFVGAPSLGYRPTAEYASNPRLGQRGMSLGTAMTISGAAASPNMGTHSSTAMTFLLTLFNARLGAWLGNPGPAGATTWRRNEPQQGVAPLMREMLGLTTASSPHVYLSDGGHFENLGFCQMLLRRCHCILVSDAGCDGDYSFEDLAAAIRQARLDLGIQVVFDRGVAVSATGHGKGNAHFAVGRIVYSAVDGPAAPDGILIYVKSALSGDEPLDIANYAAGHPAFPHEPTSDQSFDEAQFESYRMLGYHSIDQVAAGYRGDTLLEFFAWVSEREGARAAAVGGSAPSGAAAAPVSRL